MRDNKSSFSSKLILLACLIFDVAIIIAFFAMFDLFTVISPLKSILILFVLMIGLILFNCAIAFPNYLVKMTGIVHTTYIIFLLITYALLSNVLSFFLVSGSITWYIVWQLILLAVFAGLIAISSFFSKGISEGIKEAGVERQSGQLLHIQLMDIEGILLANKQDEGMAAIIEAFKRLKERFNASTPFTRINDNSLVTDLENKVKEKLNDLQAMISPNLMTDASEELHSVIEEIRTLVKQREQIIIK